MIRRAKILIASNASLLLVLIAISLGIRQPLLHQFSVMEQSIMAKQVAQVADALILESERLDLSALSEATWTDMHRYLGTEPGKADPDFYVQTYYQSIGEWNYDVIGLFDSFGTLRHLDVIDGQTRKLRIASETLRQQIAQSHGVQRFPANLDPKLTDSRNTFALASDTPLLLACRPALKSNGEGPRNGTIIIGKELNSAFLANLTRNTTIIAELIPTQTALHLPVLPRSALPEHLPVLPRSALPEHLSIANHVEPRPFLQNSQRIEIVDDKWLESELDLLDDHGHPAYRLRLRAPRLEYLQGQSMLNQLTSILLGVGISLGLVISWLLNRNFQNQQRLEASQVALQASNLELESLANLDGLTDVANRRYFDQYLRQEWRRAQRNRSALTIILCDVDHFKNFNDTYGHLAGDDCLKQVASAIKHAVQRPADLVARYGGEEFAVVLPQTSLAGGTTIALQILTRVQALQIENQLGIAALGASETRSISVSIGLASVMPESDAQPEELLQRADQNLYRAKQNGRNQICARED